MGQAPPPTGRWSGPVIEKGAQQKGLAKRYGLWKKARVTREGLSKAWPQNVKGAKEKSQYIVLEEVVEGRHYFLGYIFPEKIRIFFGE